MKYEVRVGNLGTVYAGTSINRAKESFCQYRDFSRARVGKAANQSVSLLADGKVVQVWLDEQGSPI